MLCIWWRILRRVVFTHPSVLPCSPVSLWLGNMSVCRLIGEYMFCRAGGQAKMIKKKKRFPNNDHTTLSRIFIVPGTQVREPPGNFTTTLEAWETPTVADFVGWDQVSLLWEASGEPSMQLGPRPLPASVKCFTGYRVQSFRSLKNLGNSLHRTVHWIYLC